MTSWKASKISGASIKTYAKYSFYFIFSCNRGSCIWILYLNSALVKKRRANLILIALKSDKKLMKLSQYSRCKLDCSMYAHTRHFFRTDNEKHKMQKEERIADRSANVFDLNVWFICRLRRIQSSHGSRKPLFPLVISYNNNTDTRISDFIHSLNSTMSMVAAVRNI